MDVRAASPQHRAVDIPGGNVGVGGAPQPGSGSLSPESRTRLLVRDPALNEEAHAVRMNVLNSSVQEARDARNTRLIMWVITLVNLPQIIAAAIIMGLTWKDETLCYRIQIWVLVHTIHLSLTLSLEWVLYYLNGDGSNSTIRLREQYMTYISQLKYGLDLVGLFWFLVGNMWVISDSARCDDGSMMYHLALWMIIISYAKIFLPCLLLLALLPVICFCLPCVIRLLSRLQDPMRGKGATKDVNWRLFVRSHDAVIVIALTDALHLFVYFLGTGDQPAHDAKISTHAVCAGRLQLLHLPERVRTTSGPAGAAVLTPFP
ncbi:hypothetical protein FI667_g14667, partial [Globisporangium splendens]